MSNRTKKRTHRDPHAEREARKYDRPVPSRELILQVLAGLEAPATPQALMAEFGLDDERDETGLRRRLQAMERDGQIIHTRNDGYGPVDKMDLVRGRVIANRDGFGFLASDAGGDDLYLSSRQMRSLMHGDRVVVRIVGVDRRGRAEAAPVEILERATRQVVGRLWDESGVACVRPDSARMPHDILIPPGKEGGAVHGQMVVAEIEDYPTKRSQATGSVVEVLGEHMAPGMEIDIAIRTHELPEVWPPEVEAEARAFGKKVPRSALRGREDLREVPLLTIDGADARDFDDAVFCRATDKGWKLLVAIADVGAYVQPGSALDTEARLRGNSVYFPERVIPMLPEGLSNGLCSLNPDVDRLCMVCEMYVNADGDVGRSRFFEAVMRSHARMTYDDVADIAVNRDRAARERRGALVEQLDALYALYQALAKARERRGAIDFDTVETRIVFGEDRKIDRIEPQVRNDAHRLIEECMVAANVAAARALERARRPGLFRVHAGPSADALADLRAFIGELGLRLGGGADPEAKHYAALIKRANKRPDAHLIHAVMLRSLARAVYSPANIGHFGLAHPRYAHFTSPIRRYPDLIVHREIKQIIAGTKRTGAREPTEPLVELGEHASMTERRADDATRDAVSWLKCEYMLDHVGETYAGVVSAVTGFGLFVMLDDVYVEGLVHISALGSDYFHFDPVHHRLEGESSGRVYRLADRIEVRVARVDLDERKVDFELAGGAGEGRARRRRGGGRYGRR